MTEQCGVLRRKDDRGKLFHDTQTPLNYAGDQLFVPNIVRATGQALMLAPLSAVRLGSVAPQDAAAACGISNMMRNLGGVIGAALVATIATKREQFHSSIIGQSVDLDHVRERIAEITNYFMAHGMADPAAARHQAIIALGNTIKCQALMLEYSDTFAVLGFVLARRRRDPLDRQAEGRRRPRRRALKYNRYPANMMSATTGK